MERCSGKTLIFDARTTKCSKPKRRVCCQVESLEEETVFQKFSSCIFVLLGNLKRKKEEEAEEEWGEKEDGQPISYVGACGKGALK